MRQSRYHHSVLQRNPSKLWRRLFLQQPGQAVFRRAGGESKATDKSAVQKAGSDKNGRLAHGILAGGPRLAVAPTWIK